MQVFRLRGELCGRLAERGLAGRGYELTQFVKGFYFGVFLLVERNAETFFERI